MKDFLKIACCLGMIYFLKIEAMEEMSRMEQWKEIANSTRSDTFFMTGADGYSEDAENAFGGAELKIDWNKVEIASKKGNTLAQYVYSQHLFALSRSLFNGERKKIRFEAYMYLLIAAAKGDFPQAIEAYEYAVDFTHKIPTPFREDESMISWSIEEAERLSKLL